MPRRERVGAAALGLAVVFAFWWFWPDREASSSVKRVVARHRPVAVPIRDRNTLEGDPESCATVHAAWAKEEALLGQECWAQRVAAGCPPPLKHEVLSPTTAHFSPAIQRGRVAENLVGCAPELASQVVVDCDEFPCLTLIPWDVVDRAACHGLALLRDRAEVEEARSEPRDALDLHYLTIPMLAPKGELSRSYQLPVDRREGARRQGLAARLLGGRRQGRRGSCGLEQEALALVEDGRRCEALLHAWACSVGAEEGESIEPSVAEEHRLAAHEVVDEIRDECPEYADRAMHVDCSDLPCVLGVEAPESGGFRYLMTCEHPAFSHFDTVTGRNHPAFPERASGSIAVVPLLDAGSLRAQTPVAEEWYFRDRSHRFTLLMNAMALVPE